MPGIRFYPGCGVSGLYALQVYPKRKTKIAAHNASVLRLLNHEIFK